MVQVYLLFNKNTFDGLKGVLEMYDEQNTLRRMLSPPLPAPSPSQQTKQLDPLLHFG